MVGKAFNKISWSTSTLIQMSQNIISLNKKLLFSLLYFTLFIYIFAKFANFHPYPWLLGLLLFGGSWKKLFVDMLLIELVGLIMKSINRDTVEGISFGERVIGVFFSLKLIWCKSNVSSNNRYSWIFTSVYCVSSSFCKALNRDLAIVVLDFSIQTLWFWRNL